MKRGRVASARAISTRRRSPPESESAGLERRWPMCRSSRRASRRASALALSGGERRRVEIARALATRPNYMLLDEPFAGIDPIAVGDIQDLVRHLTNRGIGVLITDHNVRETLGLTDRAYIVYAGEILTEGNPDEIVANPDVRRLYLGEEFRL
jgi:lipopolysaccharide export system ATP-binding protein